MRIHRVFIALLVLVGGNCFADASSSSSSTLSTVEILGRLPSIEDAAISPDGSRLAMIRTKGDKRMLVMISLADGKVVSSQEISGVKLRDFGWADNGNLLFMLSSYGRIEGVMSSGRYENWVLGALNLEKNRVVNPLNVMPETDSRQRALTASNQIIGTPSIRKVDGDMVVFVPGISELVSKGFMPTMFKFKVGVNVTWLVGRANDFGTRWIVDDAGKQVVTSYYDQDSSKWNLYLLIDGRWKQVVSEKFAVDYPGVSGLSWDGKSVLVEYYNEAKKDYSWMSVSLADGKITNPTPELEKYGRFRHSMHQAEVLGGYRHADDILEFFDPKKQELWSAIDNAMQGHRAKFVSASDDWKKIVFTVEGKKYGYSYMLFDVDKFKFTSLGAIYNGYTNPAEVKVINYTAQDNYQLEAIVTYPDGPRKNLPVVVLPHGGPESRDKAEFDWWAQAMASQGYLVIQPNFRGSNTTMSLRDAGFGEWGRKMQSDVSDALQKLVKDGVADPKRACIVGGSYGGYAALAGVTLETGVYRCSISLAGISDLKEWRRSVMSEYNRRNSAETRYIDRYLGVSGQDDPVLVEKSPITYVSKIDVPVLLIHGSDDSTVPIKQSEIMFDAMKKANKNVEFIKLEKDDHYLSNSNTRYQAVKAMVDFLKKYNPPN